MIKLNQFAIKYYISHHYFKMQYQMEPQNNFAQVNKKFNAFRNKIRRDFIDNYFEKRRQEIFEERINQQLTAKLSVQLSSRQARLQFLQKYALKLRGEPQTQWKQTIILLNGSIQFFEGQFEEWIKKDIIGSLILIFKQQYKHMQLSSLVCRMFGEMIYLSRDSSYNFTSHLMEYEIIQDIVDLADCPQASVQTKCAYFSLLQNICYSSYLLRDRVLNSGGGFCLISFGRKLIQNPETQESALQQFLFFCQDFLKVFKGFKERYIPNLNFVSCLFPLLSKVLEIYQLNENLLKRCLRCFDQISRIEKESIYNNLYSLQGFIESLIQFSRHKMVEVRYISLVILGRITYSSNPNIGRNMIGLKLLDSLWEGYSKSYNQQVKNNDSMLKLIFVLLFNLTANSQADANQIYNHKIFYIIIDGLVSPKIKIKRDALGCLYNIVIKLKFSELEELITKFQILKLLVAALLDLNKIDLESTQIVLSTLTHLIEFYQGIYSRDGNRVTHELENIYNISNVLENINCHNKIINQRILRLQDNLLRIRLSE